MPGRGGYDWRLTAEPEECGSGKGIRLPGPSEWPDHGGDCAKRSLLLGVFLYTWASYTKVMLTSSGIIGTVALEGQPKANHEKENELRKNGFDPASVCCLRQR